MCFKFFSYCLSLMFLLCLVYFYSIIVFDLIYLSILFPLDKCILNVVIDNKIIIVYLFWEILSFDVSVSFYVEPDSIAVYFSTDLILY